MTSQNYFALAAQHRRFHPAPGWPTPPAGWTPPPGWQPDPSWPPPPRGWRVWENAEDVEVRLVPGQCAKCERPSGTVYTFDCVAYNKTAVNSSTQDWGNRRLITTNYRIHDVVHLQAGVCADCVAGSRKSAYRAGIVVVCCLPVIVGLLAMFYYMDYSGVVAAVLMFVLGPIFTLLAPVLLYEGLRQHVSLDYLVRFKSDIMKGRTESDFSTLYAFRDQVKVGAASPHWLG